MYVPDHFAIDDRDTLAEFIAMHAFATLVSAPDGVPFATHLPLKLRKRDNGDWLLAGHVARANPQWRHLDGSGEVLAIFHGPHCYVSPTWYTSKNMVPTWNYAVAHVYGKARAIDDAAWLHTLVTELADTYESGRAPRWRNELPSDFEAKLLAAIVGIELEVTRVEGKFKLSQNRSRDDRQGVVTALRASADADDRAIAALMAVHAK